MKHKVSELEGAELDSAVARAAGISVAPRDVADHRLVVMHANGSCSLWCPSTDWSQGGPIIERERIVIIPWSEGNDIVWLPGGNEIDWPKSGPVRWWAEVEISIEGWYERCPGGGSGGCAGSTALIAAMRAYVASKFGTEVDNRSAQINRARHAPPTP